MSKDKALEFYERAADYAGILKEPFYQASTMIEMGDFYAFKNMFKYALKNYFMALDIAKLKSSSDNLVRIEKRIEDIKVRLGADEFIKVQKEILNER